MSRHLHCLGTAGYHPNDSRHTSCYFLPEAGIVLDAGTGMFRLAELIQTDVLDILLSHAHLDHVAGLTFLLDTLYQRPVSLVRIWGQSEKLAAIREHLFAELIFPVSLDVQWCEIDGRERFPLPSCEVSWLSQDHPGGSVGYRLDWTDGFSLLYLTDTTGDTSPEAMAFYGDAQLMMHECYFRKEHQDFAKKTGHTWTEKLAAIARGCQPNRLLLTHVNPLDKHPRKMLDEVRHLLDSPSIKVQLAEDKLALSL